MARRPAARGSTTLEHRRERWERRTDAPLLVLAVLFLIAFLLPFVVPLTPAQDRALRVLDVVVWAAFTADYLVRLVLSVDRWRFVRSHPLDLLIILLPLLRPLRGLQVLRVLRVGAVMGVASRRARRAVHVRVSTYVAGATVVLICLAAVAVLEAERRAGGANITTLPDALWWAVATVTTVGYGDRFPTTGLGRLVATGLMLVGIALLGVVTAAIAAWFVERLRDVEAAEERREATLTDVLSELRQIRERLDALPSAPEGAHGDDSRSGRP